MGVSWNLFMYTKTYSMLLNLHIINFSCRCKCTHFIMSHSFRYAYSIYTLGSVIKLSPEWHMLMSANVKVSINPMWWKNEYVRCLIRDYQKCDHKEVQQNAVLYCITQIIKVKNNIPDIACNYQFRLKELHARKKFANWHYF